MLSLKKIQTSNNAFLAVLVLASALCVDFVLFWIVGRFGWVSLFVVRAFCLVSTLVTCVVGFLLIKPAASWRWTICALFCIASAFLLCSDKIVFSIFASGVKSAVFSKVSIQQLEALPATLRLGVKEAPSRRIPVSQIPLPLNAIFQANSPDAWASGAVRGDGPILRIAWRDVRFSYGIAVGGACGDDSSELYCDAISSSSYLFIRRYY